MKKQFDIIVYPTSTLENTIQDPALEYFPSLSINDSLHFTTAEWIIILHHDLHKHFSVNHLNEIANVCLEFPMIDCFSPILEFLDTKLSPYLLDYSKGVTPQNKVEGALYDYVAAPHPYLTIVSRRIVQRTGALDLSFPLNLQFLDWGLRMYHAQGKVFSFPLQNFSMQSSFNTDVLSHHKELALVLHKNLGFKKAIDFMKKNFSWLSLFYFIKNYRTIRKKRRKATLLSPLRDADLEKLYHS
ncbi:MAG: hypothetical protein GX116_00095 [Fibrobacter sp.]|nr:hypothetical protein [Fibrobacter sp.]